MNPLKLALITRRYWPLVGGAEKVMANLGQQFRLNQHQVQIVTASWHKSWPSEIIHREVPVTRLPNPSLRGWGTFRYMMSLGRWLRINQNFLDLAYVSMLKHSAYTTIKRLKNTEIPVVLRAEGAGQTGDCQWQKEANFGSQIKQQCLLADAIIAPSERILNELLSAGYSPEKLHYIPNGVAIPESSSQVNKSLIRQALTTANASFLINQQTPVAIYTGRFHPKKDLITAIRAWKIVNQKFHDAQLLLVGEGEHEVEIRKEIDRLQLKHNIILPGVFDEVNDLLQAADLFILPSLEEGMSISLLEAMAADLPVIASDIQGNRKLVQSEKNGILFTVQDHQQLAQHVIDLFTNKPLAYQLAKTARETVSDRFSLQKCAEEHEALFRDLIEQKKVK